MKFIHLLFVILLLPVSCGIFDSDEPSEVITFSNTLERSIISTAVSLFQTPDSGFILLGSIDSLWINQSFALTKVDKNGDVLQSHELETPPNYVLLSGLQTLDGSFVLLGRSNSYGGTTETIIIVVDNNGNILNQNIYQVGISTNISQTSDGGFIIVGNTYAREAPNYSDIIYTKIDASGNIEWSKTIVREGHDSAVIAKEAINGGFILLVSNTKFVDTGLLKIDKNGNEVWLRTINIGYPLWFEITFDNAYAIVGGATGPTLIKADQNAQQLWSKSYSAFSNYSGKIFQQTFDGGYIIGSETTGLFRIEFTPSADIMLIKVDSNGKEQWNRTFGGDSDDWVRSVIQTSDGGYLILGQTTSFGEYDSQVWLIKTGPDGRL